MLVGSEFVGAVIGRQGQTIHGITTQTRARYSKSPARQNNTIYRLLFRKLDSC